MRFPRLLTSLLIPALLGLPVLVLGSAGAWAAETGDTRLVVKRYPKIQLYRSGVTVGGRLDEWDGDSWEGAGPGRKVTLERRRAGADSFSELASATTDENGGVVFSVSATRTAAFRLVFSEDAAQPPTYSRQVTSFVRRDLGATQPVAGSRRLVWRGDVDPGWGGRTVLLQRRTCRGCDWKHHDRDRATADGDWVFRVGSPATGSWFFRAVVPKTEGFVRSESAVLRTFRA